MIMFLSDWYKFPKAIIDTSTKNQSFVRMAALYKEMGVENHAFLLALHNPELQGVDPHSANLTLDQMAMIAIECKTNFWYYIREVVIAPGGMFGEPLQFKANRGNIALFWLFFNHITQILIQPRQTGKSFSTDELMTYLLNIRCTNTQINLLTKDDTLRSANLERLKKIELELPFYLKQRGKGDIGNTEELSIKSLGNSYKAHLPNKSPKMALNVGRGLTSPIFQVDEAAFFFNIALSLPAALSAGIAAREMARRKNEPYGIILTTTAGKKDDRDGLFIYELMTNSAIWTDKFLDAENQEALELIVRRNSPKGELRVNCTFNHRQLGYTDAWLKEAMETSLSKEDAADRDLFNIWTSGSQSSPLKLHLTKMIRESERPVEYTEMSIPHGYIIRWYLPETRIIQRMSLGHYIMSIDSSDAAGGDDIAMVFRDVRTGEVVAAANVNETNLISYCEWLVTLFVRFQNMTAIIERRSTGAMIMDYLLLMLPSRDINPFKRLYNKVVQEALEYPDRFKEINRGNFNSELCIKFKKLFGFATSATGATSRSELYSTTLVNAATITGDKVYDKTCVDQILSLVIRNGRVDHAEGHKDDSVISWLLSFYLIHQGRNLHYYGINSRDILVDNQVNQKINDPVLLFNKQQQANLRYEIEVQVEELKKEKNEYVAYKLENKLRQLATKLNEEDRQILSVDELVAKIREARKQSFKYNRY